MADQKRITTADLAVENFCRVRDLLDTRAIAQHDH